MGAGGTNGGTIRFLVGTIMTIGGAYLLLNAIKVDDFRFGHQLYQVGGYGVTSGMILIPFIFGVGIVFYNAKNILGWLLSVGSLVALIFGVISHLHFSFQRMSAFSLIVILVLLVGGIGILLSSLKEFKDETNPDPEDPR